MSEDVIAKGAFFSIVNYCDECDGCIFFNENIGCIFTSGEVPRNWELPESK